MDGDLLLYLVLVTGVQYVSSSKDGVIFSCPFDMYVVDYWDILEGGGGVFKGTM